MTGPLRLDDSSITDDPGVMADKFNSSLSVFMLLMYHRTLHLISRYQALCLL